MYQYNDIGFIYVCFYVNKHLLIVPFMCRTNLEIVNISEAISHVTVFSAAASKPQTPMFTLK